jgi:HTH-type transcriptional regulator / antitoxin HigA
MNTSDKTLNRGNKKPAPSRKNRTALMPQPAKKTSINRIDSNKDYDAAMQEIDHLMSKGSKNVSKEELARIRRLALLAQAFEKKTYVIPAPTTFAGIIEMKMYEMRLKQKDLAKKLHVSDAKLSLIMHGKQKPDIDFIKAVYHELNVDANLIMRSL